MNKIIIPIIVIIVSFSLLAVFTTLDSESKTSPVELENNELESNTTTDTIITTDPVEIVQTEPEPQPTPEPTQTTYQTGLGFSVNVSGDMHDKSFFKIYGNIPDNPNHLTGTIRTGEGDALRIIYVFQIELDEGINQYEEQVGINADYLWEEDTTYTVSINHGDIIKEVKFHRGTTVNNFADSKVPII